MSKAVLISIRPEWCKLIASGEKTIEIRKTRPKLEPPFKCYIYETQGDYKFSQGEYIGTIIGRGRKRVIGEFICDALFPISFYTSDVSFFDTEPPLAVIGTCLTDKEIVDYLGNGKKGYGWHISDLTIYDEPKILSEFSLVCEHSGPCNTCKRYWPMHSCFELRKAPQSWCYVEV